jgi:hypothetical protein
MTSPHELSTNATFCVGVTGHRLGRLTQMDEPRLRQRLHDILAWLIANRNTPASLERLGVRTAGEPFSSVALLSALAEGADQMAAEEALRLDCILWCALPFSCTNYEADFSTAETRAAYRALLAQAEAVTELRGSRASEEAAYADVGHFVVARSNVLLAIWDGGGAHGPGGTASIVAAALECGRSVIWINARPPHQIRLLIGSEQRSPVDITEWFLNKVDA